MVIIMATIGLVNITHGETLAFPPELQPSAVVFQRDARFMANSSLQSNPVWDGLVADGRGFVVVNSPEKYNLKPGVKLDDGSEKYSVSMFHQLQCLKLLRSNYYATTQQQISRRQNHDASHVHINHCFDYLRQAIMCCGDLTLEWPSAMHNSSTSFDGWGIAHKCRSWHQALQWTSLHKAPHNGSHP
ncbi:hypothetical protein CDD81_1991 [Ophiocordyceps australis]|uniref:Oxidase ustYa n=1 Tax=Ophiocordyceps australis TaxID=1399860 RepID=A0A2C5YCX1_9HYPO|nr:hypothetical protein CDD81_1991 [Ophiocordyceps australis]